MSDWNPEKYLLFKKQRTQPAIDLAGRVRDCGAKTIVDIGCGPGNSTAVLQSVFPQAKIKGIDTSESMIEKAKEKYKDAHSLINAGYAAQNISNIGYNYYTGRSEPVYATADGIVESIRDDNQRYGYGNLVRLSHVLGFSTAYTNLEKVSVKKGDFVSKGDIIGYTTASPGKNYISLYYFDR